MHPSNVIRLDVKRTNGLTKVERKFFLTLLYRITSDYGLKDLPVVFEGETDELSHYLYAHTPTFEPICDMLVETSPRLYTYVSYVPDTLKACSTTLTGLLRELGYRESFEEFMTSVSLDHRALPECIR